MNFKMYKKITRNYKNLQKNRQIKIMKIIYNRLQQFKY